MRMGAAIRDHRIWRRHAFESVPNSRRNYRESMVVCSHIHLHQVALSRRIAPIIVYHEFDAATDTRVVQRHITMFVPAFDDILINGCEVYLTEFDEMWVCPSEHMEYRASFIGDAPKRDDLYAFNQIVSGQNANAIGQWFGLAQTIFTSGTGIMNLPPLATYSACCAMISSAKFQANNSR